MRYSNIEYFEIVNGTDVGVSLYTQGCPKHCKGCFNEEAWDFNGGEKYTIEFRDKIIAACCRPGIKRFSILGGEPLLERNRDELMALCSLIKEANPYIKIWVYTGNTYEELSSEWNEFLENYVDFLVDGPFEITLKDLTLPFRGSSNQRIIDIKASIDTGDTVCKSLS
jgi:anaerobic ribonucleoside-triphosphate reductase activating protein